MPIYEEKLMCPLAVRFTQEHIRPQFQDGKDIEATIRAIKTRPGTGAYDIILEAPFPVIEIMRWHQWDDDQDEQSEHWFTVDNRRLYCLQRVAASLWPRRVAAVVEAMYARPDGAHRKSDSSTVGRSVGIGHSLKALVDRWDWRKAVEQKRCSAVAPNALAAHQLVIADDMIVNVKDLQDAPAPPSMLDLYLMAAAAATASENSGEHSGSKLEAEPEAAESTKDGSSPRSADGASSDASDDYIATIVESLSGTWQDTKGVSYVVKPATKASWTCLIHKGAAGGGVGARKVSLWYDERSGCICWGSAWSHYCDASALLLGTNKTCDEVAWYGGNDAAMRKPRFVWTRLSR